MDLVYTGDVFIKTRNHNYHFKNAGTDGLFKLLVSMLAGSYVSPNALPAYIQLIPGQANVSALGSTPVTNGCLFNPISITKHVDIRTTKSTAKWTTVISGVLIPDNIQSDLTESEYHLVLMDGQKYPLAVINLNKVSILDLKRGEETLIQWNLSFSNGAST